MIKMCRIYVVKEVAARIASCVYMRKLHVTFFFFLLKVKFRQMTISIACHSDYQ